MLPSFIFNANETSHEDLMRRRALAEQMLQRGQTGIASNLGEGIGQFGQALAGRLKLNSANSALSANRAKAYKMLAPAFGGTAAAAPGKSKVAGRKPPADIASGILETAKALGIKPMDLATAISYETAGTFDPAKKGPRTQWGRHQGLIQFGEPQAKQYGVDWNDPVGSQLGADGAVAKYLRNAGVKPGMGMMDIYSAINAGQVGRYGASDANNGGAPGTVADKVNGQMVGHRAKAEALLQNAGQIQPASAPPPGMQADGAPAPMGAAMTGFPPQPAPMAPQTPQPASAPPQMAPEAMPPQAPMTAYQRMMAQSIGKGEAGGLQGPVGRQQMASVMQGNPGGGGIFSGAFSGLGMGGPQAPAPEMAGAPAPAGMEAAPMGAPAGGNRLQELSQIITSGQMEWLDPATQQFIMQEYEREYARANPEPTKPMEVGDRLVDPSTGKVIYDGTAPPEAPSRPMTVEEKKAYGIPENIPAILKPDGSVEVIKDALPKESAQPAGIQEYEYAKKQGFPGTFQDWEASKKGGMSLHVDPTTGEVTFSQGGNIKPLTESQSKDTVYATRAEGALKKFEPVANSMTEFGSGIIGNALPGGLGNYLKSSEYQQAEQAGREFLAAVLRKDSGGAITSGEVDEYGGVYLPRPGDGPEVLAQKTQSRARAVAAIKAGMTPQAILQQEKALLKEGESAPPQAPQTGSAPVAPVPAPVPTPSVQAPPPAQPEAKTFNAKDPSTWKPGDVVLGYRYKGGDRRDSKNWEKVQ